MSSTLKPNVLKKSLIAAVIAVPALGLSLWTASAQPPAAPAPVPPAAAQPGDKPHGDRGPRAERGRSEWAERLRDEVREHPSLGRALLSMHEAKDYLERTKVDGDWGGHKAASIKACDDAIKELSEAIKFDPKRPPRGDGQPPGDKRPGDDKPNKPDDKK